MFLGPTKETVRGVSFKFIVRPVPDAIYSEKIKRAILNESQLGGFFHIDRIIWHKVPDNNDEVYLRVECLESKAQEKMRMDELEEFYGFIQESFINWLNEYISANGYELTGYWFGVNLMENL